MSDDAKPTDVMLRIDKELSHPVMRHTGSGEVEEALLRDAKAEIERLRAALEEIADLGFGPVGTMRRIAKEALRNE